MNKFLAITLLALVASASCNPIRSAEDTETDLLIGNERLFGDFCVKQGQKIKSDLGEFTRQTSAEVTKIFFGNVNEITDDVINVQKEAVAALTAQLAKPSTEIVDDAALDEDQIAKLIKEGKEAIQNTNGVAGVVPATKATFSAMLSTVNSAVFTRLAKARSMISGLNLYKGFIKACEKIADYEVDMDAALVEAKREIAEQNADNAEIQKFVEDITVTNLNCFTTKNIVRLHGFCDIVQAGHKYFFKMLGMESPLVKYESA